MTTHARIDLTADNLGKVVNTFTGAPFPVPKTYTFSHLASDDDKWATLASIGIDRRPDITPLVAWRDACLDLWGHPDIDNPVSAFANAAELADSKYLSDFMYYLA